MSDDDSNDGLAELQELMAEYATQDDNEPKPESAAGKAKLQPTYVEVPMEKVIFGDKQKFLTNLAKSVGQKRPKHDRDSDGDDDGVDKAGKEESSKKLKPAWSDSDDEDIELGDVKKQTRHTGSLKHLRKDKSYKEYLTARFQRSIAQPKWASLEQHNDANESEDEELLKTVGFIDYRAKTEALQPKSLQYKRVKDLNRATYSESVVTSIQFHPTSTAALVTGESCLANIYCVDGQKNDKLHSIRFRNFPIMCARITPCGTKAFFGSMNRHYYAYDLLEARETKLKLPAKLISANLFEISPCGKYIAMQGKNGDVHLLTAHTNELINTFKQEGQLRDMCFTADSRRLLCCGASCNVNVLSLRQHNIEHIFVDDGCVNGRSIALSPSQRMLATGSDEGVVNIYDYESVYKSKAPQPEKRFLNLRTAVTGLEFNHSSELLAMSSRHVPGAVKLAHFPSATVYARFPSEQDNVGNVKTMAFSPHSAYLALGLKVKRVPLFRLKYFKNY
ncbi:hypothetical protein KR222_008047 [Zaprionus bogoriensis]|nr:hypothetical protein KR222_008047 [Zaprionus bogoriensis]